MAGDTEAENRMGEPNPRDEKDALRLFQRNYLLIGYDTDQRIFISNTFPQYTLCTYSLDHTPKDGKKETHTVYVDDLLRFVSPLDFEKKEGDGFRLLFGLACTAQRPEELANIYNGIRVLSQIKETRETEQRIRLSHRKVLERTMPITSVSREAAFIDQEIHQFSGEYPFAKDRNWMRFMQAIANKFFIEGDIDYQKRRKYLVETAFFMLLHGGYSHQWRVRMFENLGKFDFHIDRYTQWKAFSQSEFANDASFWEHVDGTWAGIDITAIPKPALGNDFSAISKDSQVAEDTGYKQRYLDLLNTHTAMLEEKDRLKIQLNSVRHQLTAALENVRTKGGEIRRLRSQVTTLEGQITLLSAVAESVSRSRAIAAERDVVDIFLAAAGLTRGNLQSMDSTKRVQALRDLRKAAGRFYSSDRGITPDEEKLKAINSFLDQWKPGL